MIAVLDYGIGNLRSAERALEHVGAEVRLVTEPAQAVGASGVVLPGVGAFGACVGALRDSGLDATAMRAIESGVPFFGICVGYQMLFEDSEESPGVRGLGVVPGSVERLRGEVRLPQMQWNTVHRTAAHSVMFPEVEPPEWMYFVHSYVPVPKGEAASSVVATTEYGEVISVAIETANLWGVQFHPEKSGAAGLSLLGRFVSACAGSGLSLSAR